MHTLTCYVVLAYGCCLFPAPYIEPERRLPLHTTPSQNFQPDRQSGLRRSALIIHRVAVDCQSIIMLRQIAILLALYMSVIMVAADRPPLYRGNIDALSCEGQENPNEFCELSFVSVNMLTTNSDLCMAFNSLTFFAHIRLLDST